MSCSIIILISTLLTFAFPTFVSSEIYQWKDSNGNIFFSDSPPAGVKAEKKKLREDSIERQETKEKLSKQKNAKKQSKDVTVIMYSTDWCPYCKKAKAYINSLGVDLIEYNIDEDKDKKEEMLEKSGGATGVPLIDVEGIIIRGYAPDAIKEAVEKKQAI